MSLTGSAATKDVMIPKGVVIAYPIINGVVDADGGIDLGYCQEAEMSLAETSRQVYTARDASKSLVIDKVTKTDYSVPLTLLSVNMDNLAIMFRAVQTNLIQTAGDYGVLDALVVTAPAVFNRARKLGKRWVGLRKLLYDGGTAAFTIGKILTATGGPGGTAEIVWKTGTVATGTLYLVGKTGTITDNDVLVDNGTPAGAAVAFGTDLLDKDIVLVDSATGLIRYVKDDDYGLDEKSGTVFYLEDGSLAPLDSLKASFDFAAKTEITIDKGAVAPEAYQIEILPFADETENRYEWTFWKCSVKADTAIKLITVAEEEINITLTFTPLSDGPGATTEYPIYKCISV